MDDESLDGHGLHCMRGDANSGMADAGCGAEQDHALLCGERRRLRGRIVASKRCGASPQEGGNNRDETAEQSGEVSKPGCGGLAVSRGARSPMREAKATST
jgi:hypothetical protein